MPSLWKKHNTIPTEDYVRIPDSSPKSVMKAINDSDDDLEGNVEEGVSESEEAFDDFSDANIPRNTQKRDVKAAIAISQEDILHYYKDEFETLKQEVTEKAYSDALRKKRGEITECIMQVDAQLEQLRRLQDEFMEKYAYELKYLAIEIAEKVMLQKIEEDDMVLKKLVLSAVSNEKATSWINVEVSERLINLVEDLKKELEKPQYYGRVSVTPVADSIGTCKVNTEEGTIVASVSEQTKNLKEAFTKKNL